MVISNDLNLNNYTMVSIYYQESLTSDCLCSSPTNRDLEPAECRPFLQALPISDTYLWNRTKMFQISGYRRKNFDSTRSGAW